MMGHDASTPATEYGPQWMNIPNFAFRNAAILSSPVTSARRARTSANAAEAARYWRMVLLVSSISIMLPSQREVRKTRIPGADGSDEHFSNLDCSRFIRPPELLLQALFDQPCSLFALQFAGFGVEMYVICIYCRRVFNELVLIVEHDVISPSQIVGNRIPFLDPRVGGAL